MEDREAASLVHWNLDQRPQLSNCVVFLEEDTLLSSPRGGETSELKWTEGNPSNSLFYSCVLSCQAFEQE